jgi:hypothetical protein
MAKFDTNRDGVLDRKELDTFTKSVAFNEHKWARQPDLHVSIK